MLRASHSPLLRADRVACSIQERPTAPRRQRAALRRAPRGGLRFCAGLRKALGYGWAQCIKVKSVIYVICLPFPNARLRMASHISVPAMQSRQHPCRTLNYDDAMVPYRERFPRAPPNNQTWATGTGPLTQRYSDRSRRDLSENATGNSHNTCRSRNHNIQRTPVNFSKTQLQ